MANSRIKIVATAAVIGLTFTQAYAQSKQGDALPQIAQPQLDERLLPPMLDKEILKLPKGEERQRIIGCMTREIFNTQNIDFYSTAFTVEASDGRSETFSFSVSEVLRKEPGGALPLAFTDQTLRWGRLQDAIERATADGHPLMVDYTTPNNEVFGITIMWDTESCS